MRRIIATVIVLVVLCLTLSLVLAQTPSQPGDPPIAALISISASDESGFVTINGAPGAVAPNAQVAIRNLYTEQAVYTSAGITGSFSARLYGPGNTPFWISPAAVIPTRLQGQPGALPGGPGVIVYGAFPEPRQSTISVTQLIIDGDSADWSAYAQTESGDYPIYTLLNQESLYVAVVGDVPPDYSQLRLTLTLNGATYSMTLDPRVLQAAALRRVTPDPAELGTLVVAAAQDTIIEVRIPLTGIGVATAGALNKVEFLGAGGSEIRSMPVEQRFEVVNEIDGVVYSGGALSGDVTRFLISGPLAQGASTWTARGRLNTLSPVPGSLLVLEMDVSMALPNLPKNLVGLRMIGQLGLQPVVNARGQQTAGGLHSNNGWSGLLTPSGLAIDNLRGDFLLDQAIAEPQQILRRGDQLVFGLRFAVRMPDDLPLGLYVPYFQGKAQVGDGELFDWTANSIFGSGPGISRLPLTRLPVVLNTVGSNTSRLAWTLFYGSPSDGSRGLLSSEDRPFVALSNRVRFDSPTYILPPSSYPIEPYLLNLLPNASDTSAAPLIPLLFPGGRLEAQVRLPDGSVEDLGSAPIVQNRVGEPGEAGRFNLQSPQSVYRLTTLNPSFTAYPFDEYGRYQINLKGTVEDVWGNRYSGGGTYSLLIAEALDMTPTVLPGTPFEVGDALHPGLHLSPGSPADVTVTVSVYPLDGSPVIVQVFQGRADRFGYYFPQDEPYTFDTPGEYVIDYEARYTDAQGRLWAGSLRSAGVIASLEGNLLAHGRRGLDGYALDLRPAWFNLDAYPPDTTVTRPVLNFPYHSGDVAWITTSPGSGIKPVIQVQDVAGVYRNWLFGTLSDYVSPLGQPLYRLALEAELPLLSVIGGPPSRYRAALVPELIVNQAYAYISAVRPSVTARQFVQGSDDPALSVQWNTGDLYNGQIGVGSGGDQPGDFLFLFGGALVRNAEAQIDETAGYAAFAVITDQQGLPRVYPPYRGAAGGPDGGPLFNFRGQPVNLFFHPTAVQPGQVLTRGETLSIAGQVAPTLASRVTVTITSPGGTVRQFDGFASAVGYFYDPSQDFTVDEIGVWQVDVQVQAAGSTSAGMVESETAPVGSVLGGQFTVYVVPEDAPPVDWNQGGNVDMAVRAGSPFNFTLNIPSGWTNTRAYYTVTMPGYVLDEGQLRISDTAAPYQYSPAQLNRIFPNLEADARNAGPAASDVVTLTFFITGSDENGTFRARSRMFTLLYDRLVSFSGGER